MLEPSQIKYELMCNKNVFENELSDESIGLLTTALHKHLKAVAAAVDPVDDIFFMIPFVFSIRELTHAVIAELIKHSGNIKNLDYNKISYVILKDDDDDIPGLTADLRKGSIKELRDVLLDEDFFSSLESYMKVPAEISSTRLF